MLLSQTSEERTIPYYSREEFHNQESKRKPHNEAGDTAKDSKNSNTKLLYKSL